ncbi:unnamed protein product [Oppiella nova]|uniref:Arrestin-like N-terminal domain-containing protein n=1 Tax=Oppiella nova TaxID=334625 RepID=A0A7R9MKD3_9ACAR|nr:unnamed protein product [Oppiella nova]CAG2178997.1 unnamed protein product [Oppiella nova]
MSIVAYSQVISKGVYEFPFSYQLPHEGISSSFIGKYGSIKYWIEAEIQRPLFTLNNKIKTKLNVDVPLVCNDIMLPLKLSAQKSDFFFHNNGSIRMDAMIDRRAYYPGEFVVIHCNVINQSSTRVIPRIMKSNTNDWRDWLQEPDLLPLKYFKYCNVPIPIGIAISVDSPILKE